MDGALRSGEPSDRIFCKSRTLDWWHITATTFDFFLSRHEIFRSKQRVSIRAWVLGIGIGSQRFDIFFKWPFNVSSLICPIQMLVEILFRFTYLCEYHLSRLSGLRMCFIHGTNLSSCIYSCLLLLYFIETRYLNSVKSFAIFSNVFKINVAYKTRYITIILQNISKKFTNWVWVAFYLEASAWVQNWSCWSIKLEIELSLIKL